MRSISDCASDVRRGRSANRASAASSVVWKLTSTAGASRVASFRSLVPNDIMQVAPARILAHQIKAARSLARLDQQELADRSGLSIPTIKRMEAGDGPIRGNYESVAAVVAALESAGIEFIPENGGGPGVRLRTPTAATGGSSKRTASKSAIPVKKTR
jgi:DNA-binding XRE family transcriptional regulator